MPYSRSCDGSDMCARAEAWKPPCSFAPTKRKRGLSNRTDKGSAGIKMKGSVDALRVTGRIPPTQHTLVQQCTAN
eukprot:6399818-Prymnesium_polylepis.1